MELTYPFRRKMINEKNHLLIDIKEIYPFLFEKNQLKREYNRLMADSTAGDCIKSNLRDLAPKIIAVAKRRNLQIPEVKSLLDLCSKSHEYEEEDADALTAVWRG